MEQPDSPLGVLVGLDLQPLVAQRFESASELTALMEEVLEPASVRDVTPLGPVEETLQALKSGGLKLAVVTNDQEQVRAEKKEKAPNYLLLYLD